MKNTDFKKMWEAMQRAGYFADHAHYADWFRDGLSSPDLDSADLEFMVDFDHSTEQVIFPGSYSHDLERLIKRSEHLWLPRLFKTPTSGTALDLGCGFGRSLAWMHKVYDRVIGVDISDHAVELARHRLADVSSVEFHVCDGDSLPSTITNESVDFIYCFNVFEHIPRHFAKSYIKDFFRILRPGGIAIFNLLSGKHEWTRSGRTHTEWSIGYSQRAIKRLVGGGKLKLQRRVRWRMEKDAAYWTWVQAEKI